MNLLASFSPKIEPVSVDEAYLDFTPQFSSWEGDEALYEAVGLARRIKGLIFQERKLTASMGIASNKFLAKVASDYDKPDGLILIPDRDRMAFLRPMPVGAIYGVGRVTAELLHGMGIKTVGDLQDYEGDLRGVVGSFAAALKRFSFGEDDRPLEIEWAAKSISAENTFDRDTEDRMILRRILKEQALEIAGRLEEDRLSARTVQVKVRYGDFTTLSRQFSVEDPIARAEEIYRLGCFLLARDRLVRRPLRLLGLGVSNLDNPSGQLYLDLKS